MFICLKDHFRCPTLLPSACPRQEISWSHAVTTPWVKQFWKSVCVHFLEEVEGNVFESGAARVCPRALEFLIYFSSFSQGSICWETFAPLLMQTPSYKNT